MRKARWIVGGLGVAIVATVVAHLPYYIGSNAHAGGGGCPFGYTAKADDATPKHHDPRMRGETPAKARPALAFTLGATTKAEVTAYVAAHGGECHAARGELECIGGAIPQTTAWFSFSHDRLDSIRTVRRDPAVETVASTFAQLERDLTAQAGAPRVATGSTADLARGPLRQAAVEYRFSDYRAVVRATNMGNGYALTEEYANLVD